MTVTGADPRSESEPAAAIIAALTAIAIVGAADSVLLPGYGAKTVAAVMDGTLG